MQIPIIQARFNSARDMAPGGIKTIPAGRSIPRARAFKSAAQSAPEAMSGPRIVMGASCALPRRVLGMFRKGGSGAGSRVGGRNPLAGLGVYLVGGLQPVPLMVAIPPAFPLPDRIGSLPDAFFPVFCHGTRSRCPIRDNAAPPETIRPGKARAENYAASAGWVQRATISR